MARSHVHIRERGCLLDAAAGTSEHGHAPTERAVSQAQWASMAYGLTATSAAWSARAKCARGAPPPERELTMPRSHLHTRNAGFSLEAATGTSEHGHASTERAVSLAQWASIGYEPTPTSAVRSACAASARGAFPPERERAVAHSRVRKRNAGCSLEAAAETSEHGRALREIDVSLAQWITKGHESTATSAARRAHAASVRGALPPEKERTMARSHVHTRERRLLVGGRGWHAGARPCIDREGRLAGSVCFHSV